MESTSRSIDRIDLLLRWHLLFIVSIVPERVKTLSAIDKKRRAGLNLNLDVLTEDKNDGEGETAIEINDSQWQLEIIRLHVSFLYM